MSELCKPKYKPEFAKMIKSDLKKGHSAIEVLAKIGISKATFFRWLDSEPLFKQAYDEGTILAEAWWIKRGEDNIDNPDFNFVYYNRVMGSRFGITGARKVRKSAVVPSDSSITISKRLENTINSINDDEVSADEVDKLSGAFSKMADVKDKSEMFDRVAALEKQAKLESKS